MEDNDDYLKKCLLEISGTVDELLSKKKLRQLNELENWLIHNYQKIQLQQNKGFQNYDNNKFSEDAIFIFDTDFRIISYSGIQNIFIGSVRNKETNLLDLINEDYQPKLKAALIQAIENRENISLDLNVKTNINIINPCTFEIDMISSNPDNNRFVGNLRYLGLLTSELIKYQSLIMDSLPGVDVYLFDLNCNYLFAGGKEKERFGLKNINFIGHSLFDVLEKKAVRLIYPFITKALQGNENEGEIRYKNEIFFLKATPVKNSNNETVAAILFSQNISSEKKLEEQLKRGREEALNADRYKSIFIANVSHEIRTPLSSIIGFTEQLQKTKLDADQENFIKLINKASDYLLHLVSEIVFLFKLGMGKVYIEKLPFSTLDLFSELSDIFQEKASEKNLRLELNISKELPDTLIGDSFRLRQILINLLNNAIRYTDKGTIILNCKVKKDGKKRVELLFEVKDTGIGISKHNLQNIFNVFEQGNKFNGNFRGGAGLGLGICKNLIELLEGEISVASKVNAGSTFTVTMPFEKASALLQPPIKEIKYGLNGNAKLLAGKKILFADDDEHILILADNILKSWQTDYTLVYNGQKAIDSLNQNKYDIILIDIHMPEKNGMDVLKHVRSNNKGINFNTTIMFITATAIKVDINNYMQAGFDGYLIKPFREEELYNKLCNILKLKPLTNNHPITEQLSPLFEMSDIFDINDLRRTANGDEFFFETTINNFIKNANNLIEILQKEKSLITWKDIGNKAHKSITSFKYFRLFKIAALLEKLEDYTLRNIDYNQAERIIDELILQIRTVINQAKSKLDV